VTKPLPVLDDLSRPYWEAARRGRLLLQQCTSCRKHQFYPRPFCLACSGSDLEWIEATGKGRLHTFALVHRTADPAFADDVPYVYAVVELLEGPHLTVNVVDTPMESLRCDMPVRIVFTDVGADATLPNARGDL
jgi:uncharacterized OB-fold protein